MEQITAKELAMACGGTVISGDPKQRPLHIRLNSGEVQAGDLFVPLIGARVDAHRFIPQAMEAGAAAVLTSEDVSFESGQTGSDPGESGAAAVIRVADTREALQAIGRYLRGKLDIPVVGVTGSVGKTTTRELIAAALSAHYRVYRTPGNSNSQVGVPITISEISGEDEIAVVELGMSEPGEMPVIAKIARPEVSVVTNIGISHIEQLGSRENIRKEKLSIQEGMSDGGLLILNGDDDMLRGIKGRPGIRTVTYGLGADCDFRAEDITLTDGKPEFTVVCEKGRHRIALQVLGRHNVYNALAAAAVCVNYGMTLEEAARGLHTFTGFAHRQQLFDSVLSDGKDILVLDDSYNASPASMRAALDVFGTIGAGRRHIAVLADMKELGEQTVTYHREIGSYAAKRGVDLLLTLGELGQEIAAGARGTEPVKDGKRPEILSFSSMSDIEGYLNEALRAGDCILFKGSNSMGLSKLADRYRGV